MKPGTCQHRKHKGFLLPTWLLACLALGVGMLLTSCNPWRESYLKDGVEEVTQEDVYKKFGPPFRHSESLLSGEDTWIYRFVFMEKDLNPMGIDTLGKGISDVANAAAALIGKRGEGSKVEKPVCLHYVLTFDKTKVLRDWKRESC